MLKQVLNKNDIVTAVVVDVGRIPFAETVGADIGIAKIITHCFQVFLNCPLRDREKQFIGTDVVKSSILAEVLIDRFRNGESSLLTSLLFLDIQAKSSSIPDYVREVKLQNITDPHAEVRLCRKYGCDPRIGTESIRAVPDRVDDRGVLIVG